MTITLDQCLRCGREGHLAEDCKLPVLPDDRAIEPSTTPLPGYGIWTTDIDGNRVAGFTAAQMQAHAAAARADLEGAHLRLWTAASGVVLRWDSPSWADLPHTAEYIEALRAAL